MLSTWDNNDKKGLGDIVCSYSIFCGEGVKATEKHCVCWVGGDLQIKFNIQGGFFNWPSPIPVPKRNLPSSQSQSFLVTGITETAAGIG